MNSQLTVAIVMRGIEKATAQTRQFRATLKKLGSTSIKGATSSGKQTKALKKQTKATKDNSRAMQGAIKANDSYFKHIAKTTVQSALINKLFMEMVDIMGQAIQQVDALNNFPATMAAMGQSTEDANIALEKTRNYVGDIGGNLGEATKMVTRFTGATNNVKAAAAIYQGLSNTLIAGGTNNTERANVITQFSQALERGFPDAKEWKTMSAVLSREIGEIAHAMGIVNGEELGRQLRTGEASMGDFVRTMTELATGSGATAKLAETQMHGLEFAWYKLKNTIVQGMSAMIDSVGRATLVNIFTAVTQTIMVLVSWTLTAINFIIYLINLISGLFGGPQLGNLGKDISDGIDTGNESVNNLKDGLDDADGSAKKLNKSLASFDKMNVLADPASGGSGGAGGGGGGGGGITPADAKAMEDFFDGIKNGLKEVSGWAKIFAGAIAGIFAAKTFFKLKKSLSDLVEAFKESRKKLTEEQKKLKKDIKKQNKETGTVIKNSWGTSIGNFLGGIFKGLGIAIGLVLGPALVEAIAAVSLTVGLVIALIALAVLAIGLIIWRNWDTIKEWAGKVWKLMQDTWDDILGAVDTVWQGIKDIFNSVWEWIKEWGLTLLVILTLPFSTLLAITIETALAIAGAFVWVWKEIVKIWDRAYGWFKEHVWDKIVEIFEGVTEWFNDQFTAAWEAVVEIWDRAYGWFKEHVWDKIVEIFDKAPEKFKEWFNAAWDGIKKAFSKVYGWFKTNVWDKLASIFSKIDELLGNPFSKAWTRIKEIFSGVWSWFKTNVIEKITGLFSGLGEGLGSAIGNAFKTAINGAITGIYTMLNGVINSINWVIRAINKISPVNISEIPLQTAPQLARGGIVDQPTLAMIGENGKEAVIPLENNTEWMDKLASQIAAFNGGGGGQPVNLTVQIGEEEIASTLIDLINEKTGMSGRNTIYV